MNIDRSRRRLATHSWAAMTWLIVGGWLTLATVAPPGAAWSQPPTGDTDTALAERDRLAEAASEAWQAKDYDKATALFENNAGRKRRSSGRPTRNCWAP